jgi:hypothetical protein
MNVVFTIIINYNANLSSDNVKELSLGFTDRHVVGMYKVVQI